MITAPAPSARPGRHTCLDWAWVRQARRCRPVSRSRGVKRESFDEGLDGDLACGESFDGDHDPTAVGTRRQDHVRRRVSGRGRGGQ